MYKMRTAGTIACLCLLAARQAGAFAPHSALHLRSPTSATTSSRPKAWGGVGAAFMQHSSSASSVEREFQDKVRLIGERIGREEKHATYEELCKAREAGFIDTEELQTVEQVGLPRAYPLGIDGGAVVGHGMSRRGSVGGLSPKRRRSEQVAMRATIGGGCGEECLVGSEDSKADAGAEKAEKKDGEMGQNTARLMVLAAAAFYGTNFGSVKILEETLDPSMAAALRFSIAAVAMSPLLRTLRPEALKDGLTIGAIVASGYIAQGLSLQTADASTAAFLCSLAVIVCPLIDAFSGKKVSTGAWGAASLAVAGAAVLELGGSSAPGMGDLLALVQPLAFGAGFWLTEAAMKKHPGQTGPLAALQVSVVAAMSVSWCLAQQHGLPSAEVWEGVFSNPQVMTALLWTGLVTTALTVFLETLALGALSSAETTLLFSTEPLWGTAFAAAMLHEHIGANTVLGGALIMCACMGRTAGPQVLKLAKDAVGGVEKGAPRLKAKLAAGLAVLLSQDVSDVV